MNRNLRVFLPPLGIGLVAIGFAVFSFVRRDAPEPPALPEPVVAAPAGPTTESLPIQRGDTLADLFTQAGIDEGTTARMVAAVRDVFDVRKLRVGSALTLTRSGAGALQSVEYIVDPDRRLQLSPSGDSFEAAIIEVPGVVRAVPVCGTMQGSLFESIERAGERPEVAIEIAEMFAWDLDFYTDPREGDQFCVLIEKKEYTNGQRPTNRRILAAKYVNAGTEYEAFLFPGRDGKPRYYARDGRSLQAAFLRSPMKFEARVSSRFSRRRFHPVLKIYRPHLGTDYAAPTGTPVQAVAAGRVVRSGRSGGAGNMIKIRHANGYESQYLHLSRMHVRAGQQVEQGQRIGAVGATGLATGPHLDFRLSRNGKFVDFERLRAPRATRLEGASMATFAAERDRFSELMETPDQTVLAAGGAPAGSASVD